MFELAIPKSENLESLTPTEYFNGDTFEIGGITYQVVVRFKPTEINTETEVVLTYQIDNVSYELVPTPNSQLLTQESNLDGSVTRIIFGEIQISPNSITITQYPNPEVSTLMPAASNPEFALEL